MTFSITNTILVRALALAYILMFCCTLGYPDEEVPHEGYPEEEVPHKGYPDEEVPPHKGYPDEEVPHTGTATDDPAQIVAKALLCFNDKYIYSSCEESYRLTQSGDLHVPFEHTDEYCNGPCLTETHLVLNCIDNIFTHFLFYNRATIIDIKDTIQAGCGYGPERGNFNVAEHIQAEENNAYKATNHVLLGLVLMVAARVLFDHV